MIGGVAAGISDRFGIGTGWVRAAFVIATFFGGAGLVLYIVGWLAIPEEGETESIAASKVVDLQGASRWIGVALIVIGGLLVLGLTNTVNGSLVWAAAFVLAGVLLYRGELPSGPHERGRPRPASPGAAGSMATPVAPANVPASDVVEVEAPVAAVSSPTDEPPPYAPMPPDPPAPPPPIPPSPKKQRSVLGRVTLAVMLLAVGTIAILDNAGTIEPSARHYLGAVVSVAGLGLIVGTWFGRARLLIAIGLLLLPALFVASVVRLPFSGDFGDKTFRPASISEVRDEYRIGAGELTIDLRGLDIADEVLEFKATVGAGQLTVIVPADAAVYVDGRVGFGEIDVFNLVQGGVAREVTMVPPAGATGYIVMEVETGFGQVEVVRPRR